MAESVRVASSVAIEHDVTGAIADYVAGDLRASEAVENLATAVLIDAIGVGIAGSSQEVAALVRRTVADRLTGDGSSTVLGVGGRTDPATAALLNGVAVHALDFDDVYWPGKVHPAATVLPTVLALAESRRSTGQETLSALVCGVEVSCAVAEWLGAEHYERGWHTTSTAGAVAAAAAGCRLLGLSADGVARALGLAASLAGGLRANFGTMAKPFHAGWAAAAGVHSAQLAGLGFSSNPRALDGRDGLLGATGGRGAWSPIRPVGGQAYLSGPGYRLKVHAACSAAHPAIDAALELSRKFDVSLSSVDEIRCTVPIETREALPHDLPTTPLEAKFSLPYCIAVALVLKAAGPDQFELPTLERRDIRATMAKVIVKTASRPDGDKTHVSIRSGADDTKSAIRSSPSGVAVSDITPQMLKTKFLQCVTPLLGKDRAARLFEDLRQVRTHTRPWPAISLAMVDGGTSR